MVKYNDNTQLPFEGNDAQSSQEVTDQRIYLSARRFARASQYYALLITLRSALMSDDGYNVERVVKAVVSAFDELEGKHAESH